MSCFLFVLLLITFYSVVLIGFLPTIFGILVAYIFAQLGALHADLALLQELAELEACLAELKAALIHIQI
jgi:uncharacterized membrane protein